MLCNNFTQEYKSHHVIIPATENIGALLLGDLNSATDHQIIKQYNIKTILTAACGLQHLKIPSELTHVVFPLMDTKQENIAMYFELSYKTIEENLKKGAVLVHCGAGISRSASLVIAYYMKKFKSNFKNAISYVRRIKPNVCPNLGFQLQLKSYENILNVDKMEQQISKIKSPKQTEKPLLILPPYLFEIPIQKINQIHLKNTFKPANRIFNKTHTQKIHHNSQRNQSQLFIKGKNAQHQNQYEENISLYQPKKYSRKSNSFHRNALSTVKKPIQNQFQ